MVKKIHLIRYNGDDVIRPLSVRLPQMISYVKCFDSNKAMSFKFTDNKLLKTYNKICKKNSNLMNIILIVNLFMLIIINTKSWSEYKLSK